MPRQASALSFVLQTFCMPCVFRCALTGCVACHVCCLPDQVRPVAEDEMFKVLKSGKRMKKSWKRMITKVGAVRAVGAGVAEGSLLQPREPTVACKQHYTQQVLPLAETRAKLGCPSWSLTATGGGFGCQPCARLVQECLRVARLSCFIMLCAVMC